MLTDLRHALRSLAKSPGFTAVAVLTLALGIGATTIVFSLAKALVLDPFPYPEHDRIVFVWSSPGRPLSSADFVDLHDQATSFSDFGIYRPERLNLGVERPEPVYATTCTAGVLRALGIAPALGRLLTDDDVKAGAPVVVISHSLWQRALGGDPAALGRTLRLDGREHTVVGIMPANFEFISPWHDGHDRELWLPIHLPGLSRDSHWLLGLARLKPGVTLTDADNEIKAIGRQLSQQYPDSNLHKPFLLRSLWSEMTDRTGSPTLLLFGAVSLLLLVACANVAGLLLARAARRQGEFGVRLALGASQRSILRLVLTESLLLAAAGTALGLVFAVWGLDFLKLALPPLLTTEARRAALGVDPLVLAFGTALTCLSTLIFGTLPALVAAGTPVLTTLKAGGRAIAGGRAHRRFLRYVVVAQVTLALVLAHGAMLLSASYLNVLADNRALDTETVLTANLALQGPRYSTKQARLTFWDELFAREHALPGVEQVAVTSKLPLTGNNNFNFLVDDQVYDLQVGRPWAENAHVSPEYFAAMDIPILRGRAPNATDATGEVIGVAVNQALADLAWPGQDPIGHRIRSNGTKSWFVATVIGVVGNVRQRDLEEAAVPEVYFPHARQDAPSMALVVRVAGGAESLLPRLRAEIAALDPDLPLADVRTMRQVIGAKVEIRRLLTYLGNAFTFAALLLAMVGIYGTLSYTLVQQRREIGIRITLGALRPHLLRFAFRHAGTWVAVGLLLGTGGSLALSALLRSLVYGLSPFAPWSLLVAAAGVTLAVFAACLAPALRATRVDPIESLRAE